MGYYVIIYDIKDDKRRTKLFKTLKEFISPVQYSVFEGFLSQENLVKLIYTIRSQINNKEDSVCVYQQCAACRDKTSRFGKPIFIYGESDIII